MGVVNQSPEFISSVIKINVDELKTATKDLIDQKMLFVKKINDEIYFIIPSHFSTVGKSDSMIEKIKSDLKSLPDEIQMFLKSIGVTASSKRKIFVKPTPEEVSEYALSLGYLINGKEFCDFYENSQLSDEQFWFDSKGKLISDWKKKLKVVWCKEKNKITIMEGVPKGFETWVVKTEQGEVLTPDGWKDGKPVSKDFVKQKILQREFNKLNKN